MTIFEGLVHGIQVSDGGVPKLPVAEAWISVDGVEGDRQRYTNVHGGPARAVCLLGVDVIRGLAADGHPIAPGTTGENVTLAGIPWNAVGVGSRFRFAGGVELETVSFAKPCKNISGSFSDGDVMRLDAEREPGQARHYCRVVTPGRLRVGEGVEVSANAAGP